MTEREIDDALGALRGTLQVEPSPAFAAGVRVRIDRDRRRNWSTWLVLSAAAAVVVIGIVLVSRSWHRLTAPPVANLASSSSTPPAPGAVQTAATETAVQPVAPPAVVAMVRQAEPTSRRVRPAMPERVLEVLVPADQRLALTKLLADLDAGRVEGAALVSKPIEPAPPSPPPSELVIAPIEIPAIGSGAGGNQIIR